MNNIKTIPVEQLHPHPDNRPLGINEEKVEQLAEMMRQNGYDYSKPIKARKNCEGYQIIEGEHRWRAAQKASINEIPVFLDELSDEEALIQLVVGNVQTDSHPLDYGRVVNRLNVKASSICQRFGLSERTLQKYAKADKVRAYIEETEDVFGLSDDTEFYYELSKCSDYDWVWLNNLKVKQNISFRDFLDISKRVRAIDKAAEGGHAKRVFNLTEIKQEVATAKERIFKDRLSLIEAVEECAGNLNESYKLFRYSSMKEDVESYQYRARDIFLKKISNLESPTRTAVFEIYNNMLNTIRQQTEENAEKDKKYYENEQNRQEAEGRARVEWEAFMPKPGTWYQLGRHWLYCGDNRDKAFLDKLPKAAFAFADPPYNAGVEEWDEKFKWEQDYLIDYAEIVMVTPGIVSIKEFFQKTTMLYKWSLSTWIKNGMTRGALGFGNWIYTAVFSNQESIHRNAQDFNQITIKTSDSENHFHKGHKPKEYIAGLIEMFSCEGDEIIDNFLGSGTMLLVCEEMNRICYGAEIVPEFCKEIIKQYRELIDKKEEDVENPL